MTNPVRRTLATVILLIAAAGCGADVGDGASIPPPDSTATTTPPPTTTTPPPTTTGVSPRFDRDAARAELDSARERWAATQPFAYRLRYAPVCFCAREEREVLVLDSDRIASSSNEDAWGHVYDWFGEIELAVEHAYDLQVAYDERGVPVSIWIDEDPAIADEEHGMELLELTPVDPVELLADEYRCGYGFWVASPTQQAALLLDVAGGEPATVGTYAVDGLARAELLLGHDLMANWCDDVMEPGEPEPAVDATWQLVAGTLEITATAGNRAEASLTGAVARSADGREVALGDLTIVNEAWGIFAG